MFALFIYGQLKYIFTGYVISVAWVNFVKSVNPFEYLSEVITMPFIEQYRYI